GFARRQRFDQCQHLGRPLCREAQGVQTRTHTATRPDTRCAAGPPPRLHDRCHRELCSINAAWLDPWGHTSGGELRRDFCSDHLEGEVRTLQAAMGGQAIVLALLRLALLHDFLDDASGLGAKYVAALASTEPDELLPDTHANLERDAAVPFL